MNTRIPLAALAAAILALASAPARGQSDDEMKAKQLVAQIKKDLAQIDALLLNADKESAGAAREEIDKVVKALDERLNQARERQNRVIDNIEELAKLTKYKQSKEGGGSGDGSGQNGGSSGRNSERPKDDDVDQLKRQGQKPEQKPENPDQKDGDKPQGKDTPESGKDDPAKPEPNRAGEKPPSGEKGEFKRDDTSGRWGNLPPKAQEQIPQASWNRIPPKYRKILEEYYHRAAEKE